MSVRIACLDCAEVFDAEAPDLSVEVGGQMTEVYRCPACRELNMVDTHYRHFIGRKGLAGLIAPEQGRERPA